MVWLGLGFGVCAALVPLGVLTTGRSVLIYRSTGRERRRALRGSLVLLALSLVWSALGLGIAVVQSGMAAGVLLVPRAADVAVALLPVIFGWLPASLLALLAWPDGPGRGEAPPPWVRWMDALWMG